MNKTLTKLIDWQCSICNEVRIWDGEGKQPTICGACLLKGYKENNGKNKNMQSM